MLNISQLEDILSRGHFALISGQTEKNTPEENRLRHTRLGASLKARGYRAWPTVGRYEGQIEKSYLVLVPNEREIVSLGRQFNQKTVAIGGHGRVMLMRCEDGAIVGTFRGYRIIGPEATDDFTEIELQGGTFARFTLVFKEKSDE